MLFHRFVCSFPENNSVPGTETFGTEKGSTCPAIEIFRFVRENESFPRVFVSFPEKVSFPKIFVSFPEKSFSSKILELKLFSGNETKNFGNETFSGNETKNFGNETFFRERNEKLRERNFLSGKPPKVSMAGSCQTFQFQNFGTETFSVVGFDHVEPFSSKILELKLSEWLDLIMSNLSVPKFWN